MANLVARRYFSDRWQVFEIHTFHRKLPGLTSKTQHTQTASVDTRKLTSCTPHQATIRIGLNQKRSSGHALRSFGGAHSDLAQTFFGKFHSERTVLI